MKKLFSILILALVMASCSNKAKDEALRQVAIKAVKDSLRLDSFKKAEVVKKQEQEKLAKAEAEKKEKKMLLLSRQREATAENAPATAQQAVPARKKGWSDAAKGTLIGGVAGAVGGAIIDKNKGRGAIIGGAVGAGTGYLIGRGKDRKSGRVQKN